MDAVFGASMNLFAKIVVQVEKVEIELLDDQRGVLIGLEHVLAQLRLGALDLGYHEAAAHVLGHGQRGRPQEDGVRGQHAHEREDAGGQVAFVVVDAVRAVACEIPASAVHDHHVGLLGLVLDVLADRYEIVRVAARDEVETNQVIG